MHYSAAVLSIVFTASASGASKIAAPPGVCDIFSSGGTPCVAAHSLTRALFGQYDGPLYSVLNAATNATKDIGCKSAGGAADVEAQAAFCGAKLCIVQRIYDQTKHENHLGRERGFPYLHSPRDAYDAGVNLTASAKVSLGGAAVYGAVFDSHCDVHACPKSEPRCCDGVFAGYSNRTAAGTAVKDQPQTVYALFDGRHYDSGCCFDYGNAEKARPPGVITSGMGAGAMEAVYFGCGDKSPSTPGWRGCNSTGPYVYSDLETMVRLLYCCCC